MMSYLHIMILFCILVLKDEHWLSFLWILLHNSISVTGNRASVLSFTAFNS